MTHETHDTDEKKDPMLLVPLYEHPADRPDAWERLIRCADRLHSVVLNPDSGPGGGGDEGVVVFFEWSLGGGGIELWFLGPRLRQRPPPHLFYD
ncbi:hypothetical protein ACFXCU_15210, partial [Streptomyces virginiae]